MAVEKVHHAVTVAVHIPKNYSHEYSTYIIRALANEYMEAAECARKLAQEAYDVMEVTIDRPIVVHARIIEHGTMVDLETMQRLQAHTITSTLAD